jgi:hypothetical protein
MHATARQLHCLTNVFNNLSAKSTRSNSNRFLTRNFTPFSNHRQLATMAPTGIQHRPYSSHAYHKH